MKTNIAPIEPDPKSLVDLIEDYALARAMIETSTNFKRDEDAAVDARAAVMQEIQDFARYGFAQGVKHATSERDRYRDLLEMRVAGLEAMLTAFVQQAKADTRGEVISQDLVKRAADYLAGSGPT